MIRNRYHAYQHIYNEIAVEPEFFADTPSEHTDRFNHILQDQIDDLSAELSVKIWAMLEAELTPKQLELVKHLAADFSYTDAGEKLKLTYACIYKSFWGSVEYGRLDKPVRGGIIKKIHSLFQLPQYSDIPRLRAEIVALTTQLDERI
jgi:hypothetical protein